MIFQENDGKKYVLALPEETERELIRQLTELALEKSGGNITNAAKVLGISRTTITMRLKRWGTIANAKEQTVQTQ